MKAATTFLFLISLSSLLASVHCYGSNGFDPLNKFLRERRRMRKPADDQVVGASLTTEYSPVYVGLQDGLKEADKISALPGQPSVNFDQYGGYVTIDPKTGKALFYYFTEAEDPSTKPLVLWLNGGPGCSSLGAGAMTELGPFRVNADGKTLWYNEFAWNKLANVLFLESPAGVGFSYSNTTSDYTTGDTKTAADAYTFLVNWLERFPEYKTRDFYITGESYAGHYVPQLAALIVKNNKVSNQTVINLKGIAVGNAYTDLVDQAVGVYEHFWTSALISDEIYHGIVQNCNWTAPETSDTCDDFQTQAFDAFSNIYIYDIYAPICSNHTSYARFDPCSDNYVMTYLNTPEVQKAFHANVSGIPGPWNECSRFVRYREDVPDTVLPVVKDLMTSGIRVWIYSGDTDGIVPVTTTRYSMPKLGAPIKTPWYPWDTLGEVGGYVVEYENVTFVSVRGAGHFVPSYQPERALVLFESFLEGKLPPPLKVSST